MTTSVEQRTSRASHVAVTDDTLTVDLIDGRTVAVPVAWYPRLSHATPAERANWRLIGQGEGVHFPLLDEDVSVAALLAGRASGESQASLEKWLQGRKRVG